MPPDGPASSILPGKDTITWHLVSSSSIIEFKYLMADMGK